MIPIDQTILHSENTKGNCLVACIASIFELDIDTIPHFITYSNWDEILANFLFDKLKIRLNYSPIDTPRHMLDKNIDLDSYYIANGPTIRGTRHSVVYQHQKLIHDPHPSKAGLIKPDCFFMFRKIVLNKKES